MVQLSGKLKIQNQGHSLCATRIIYYMGLLIQRQREQGRSLRLISEYTWKGFRDQMFWILDPLDVFPSHGRMMLDYVGRLAIFENAGWSCLCPAQCPARVWSKRQTFGKSVELKSAKYSWDRIWSNTFKLQHGVGLSQSLQCLPTQGSLDQNRLKSWGVHDIMNDHDHDIMMPLFPWYPLILIWCHSKWCTIRVFCNWRLTRPCFNNRPRHSPPTKLNQLKLSAVTTWPESQSIIRDCCSI